MKLLILLFLCSQTSAWRLFHRGRSVGGNLQAPNSAKAVPPEQWFVQKLDHFDPTNQQTWKQRYFINDTFFNGTTVFLMIGGEGEASAKWMVEGTWIDYAERFGALCFQLEHRYYGKSQPMPNLSTKNLQYLTSQQALGDLANFIVSTNTALKLPAHVKWIVFGGSYPGSLAAWMRMKYPHLVHGAMSASGPLLAQLDFKDYFRVVDESLQSYSEECLEQVEAGTLQIEVLLHHMIGQRTVTDKFKLCDPIEKSVENKNDISNFYETLAGNFAGIVQYNKDNRRGSSARTSNITIDTLCDIMTDGNAGSAMDRLAAVNSLLLASSDQKCLDYKYDKMIKEMRNISLTLEGGRQWTYQTCTEFGFFQTSSYQPQIFGDQFPVDFFVQQCTDIFGPKFNREFLNGGIEWSNLFYGALDIEVSNVVFVHGSVDPWHALGITATQNPHAPAIYIQGTAHCANMYPRSPKDPPQLNEAREQIGGLLEKWIS